MPRAILLALVALAPCRPAVAAETPFKGNWKLTVTVHGEDVGLALLRIEGHEATPTITVLDAGLPQLKDARVEGVHGDAGSLRFTLDAGGVEHRFVAFRSRSAVTLLVGSEQVRNQFQPIALEHTAERALDVRALSRRTPGGEVLPQLRGAEPARQDELVKGLAEKYPERPVLFLAAREVLLARARRGADAAQLRSAGDAYLRSAAQFGPELELFAAAEAAAFLNESARGAALGLDYARRAEKLLPGDASAARQADVLKTLAAALRKNGKSDELKTVQARLDRLNETLDAEFSQTAVPFAVKPYAGREGKSRRVVVVELFTAAQCPPCVAADVAFDALLRRYRPAEVVLLQYHLHVAGPDPLTGPDTEKRADAYGVEKAPALFLDGQRGPDVFGPRGSAASRYQALLPPIDEALETAAPVTLKATAERKGDRVDVTVEGVRKDGKPGGKMRLRLVLVEETARFAGNNGQRLHQHVVRSFPGGVDGFPFRDGTVKQAVRIDVGAVRKAQEEYLAQQSRQGPFPAERPLELRRLKVIALVQDDGGAILQAVQIDVPEAK